MAGKNIDTDALGEAAAALGIYISDVQNNIQKMYDAAQDCSDNMGSDTYSMRAIEKFQACAKELSKSISRAEELRKTILTMKKEIEDSGINF